MTTRPPDPARPVIAISMGDPAGVGPELCLRALRHPAVADVCTPLVFGDAAILDRVAAECGLDPAPQTVPYSDWQAADSIPPSPAAIDLALLDVGSVRPGRVQADCGRAAFAYVRAALDAVQGGRAAALATAPLHKEALNLAGVPYPGHTEMLADLTHAGAFCMMLASDRITVSLVTTHVALTEVPGSLETARIVEVISLTDQAMRHVHGREPQLLVCGLNPHGGEHGLFGNEEQSVIAPAVEQARARGARVHGPVSPDTAFLPSRMEETDAYIVMYHDQGLIPFKMLAFEKGVNVTLGLPIVRTSVDHGTAFDIAWQGRASVDSLVESVRWAVRLSRG